MHSFLYPPCQKLKRKIHLSCSFHHLKFILKKKKKNSCFTVAVAYYLGWASQMISTFLIFGQIGFQQSTKYVTDLANKGRI